MPELRAQFCGMGKSSSSLRALSETEPLLIHTYWTPAITGKNSVSCNTMKLVAEEDKAKGTSFLFRAQF